MLGSPFSIHNDVLCAVPEDAASADRLVEEIKRRAKYAQMQCALRAQPRQTVVYLFVHCVDPVLYRQQCLHSCIGSIACAPKRALQYLRRPHRIAIQSRNYPEANALYTKALSVQPSAILHANRSLVRLSLNQAVEALEDANAAIGEART
jgi:hypothetical protein